MKGRPAASLTQTVAGWSVRETILATLSIAGVLLAFAVAYRFSYIFMALIVAIMLHIAMRPLIEQLAKWGISKHVGVTVAYLLLVAAVGGFLLLLVPLLVGQLRMINERLPAYYTNVYQWLKLSEIRGLAVITGYLPAQFDLGRFSTLLATSTASQDATLSTTAPAFTLANGLNYLFLLLAIFTLAYYWTRDRERVIYQFLLLLPAERRPPARELINEVEAKVGAYYRGQLILCAAVGGICMVGFWAIGLPYAFTLGAFAFVFEAVPMIGPILGAIPAIFIALTISPRLAIKVIVINVVVQLLENNFLVPRIMDRAVGVNAIVTIVALATFSLLFGLPGALLAIPLAAILQVLFERLVFNLKPETEAEQLKAVATTDDVGGRNRFSVLRLETQDLAHDIRQRLRRQSSESNPQSVSIEEMIEALALNFDQLLANREKAVVRQNQVSKLSS
jgi:predicted PurR-regulated permease PerM